MRAPFIIRTTNPRTAKALPHRIDRLCRTVQSDFLPGTIYDRYCSSSGWYSLFEPVVIFYSCDLLVVTLIKATSVPRDFVTGAVTFAAAI
ncbi:MAG TPA: hypothetical protein DCS07_06695 [Bdellovibrionales bacterium]|nr:MAG: hypothetical protein A2Z97_08150 [Bdellovibrionales bacterium GWB1_52_6]OFZ03820.1 MAG: hypothetical protein A2X97_15590 [Bdellovibrionales bacterium GWA1_52_35]OFZ39612.1 MAG: hypothetical protein A2070_05900 [Bdellovibrionales bacterium GWC1_52_8]HAR42306.1 hypothetical protein [Bdellovibrionales bacterium]HCM39745.1 hypothetical protein [Bdellovibrionales bacterium]